MAFRQRRGGIALVALSLFGITAPAVAGDPCLDTGLCGYTCSPCTMIAGGNNDIVLEVTAVADCPWSLVCDFGTEEPWVAFRFPGQGLQLGSINGVGPQTVEIVYEANDGTVARNVTIFHANSEANFCEQRVFTQPAGGAPTPTATATATASATPTATATASPTSSGGCSGVIANGSLEDAGAGWQAASTTFGSVICNSTCGGVPRTGDFYAFFGGSGGVQETGTLTQSVAVPAGQNARLQFFANIGALTAPEQSALVVSYGGEALLTITPETEATNGYVEQVVAFGDLADGTAKELAFTYNGTRAGILVDDIALLCGGATPTPTATATATATATSTATATATSTATATASPTPCTSGCDPNVATQNLTPEFWAARTLGAFFGEPQLSFPGNGLRIAVPTFSDTRGYFGFFETATSLRMEQGGTYRFLFTIERGPANPDRNDPECRIRVFSPDGLYQRFASTADRGSGLRTQVPVFVRVNAGDELKIAIDALSFEPTLEGSFTITGIELTRIGD